MFLRSISITLTFFLLVKAQSSAPNLTALLGATEQLSTLTGILSGSPELLNALLSIPTNLTILAPSNAAFEKAMADIEAMGDDESFIPSLLSYHVLNGTFFSTVFQEGITAAGPTLLKDNTDYANLDNDSQVVLGRVADGDVMIYSGLGRSSGVETADVQFDKGVVHIIDTVLTLPQKISTTALGLNLTAVAAALQSADLLETVDNTPKLTVFAPNNAAFQSIGNLLDDLSTQQLSEILTYHVVTGDPLYDFGTESSSLTTIQGGKILVHEVQGEWYVNGARIVGGTEGGVVVANGVVYVIDSVLNPATGDSTTYTPIPTASTQPPSFPSASFVSDLPFTATPTADVTSTSTSTERPVETGSGSPKVNIERAGVGAAAFAVVAVIFGMGGLMV